MDNSNIMPNAASPTYLTSVSKGFGVGGCLAGGFAEVDAGARDDFPAVLAMGKSTSFCADGTLAPPHTDNMYKGDYSTYCEHCNGRALGFCKWLIF
jgi:hypothetical protein